MEQFFPLASQLANAYKALASRAITKDQWEEAVKNSLYFEQIAMGGLVPHQETTIWDLQTRLHNVNNQLNFGVQGEPRSHTVPGFNFNNRAFPKAGNPNLARAYQVLTGFGALLGLIAIFIPWLLSNGNYEAGWYSFFNSIPGISTSGGAVALIFSILAAALIFIPMAPLYTSILTGVFGIAITGSGALAYSLKLAEFREYQNKIGMQMVQNRPYGSNQDIVLPEPGAAIGIGPGIYIAAVAGIIILVGAVTLGLSQKKSP